MTESKSPPQDQEPSVTEVMGYPILTLDQKQALLERADHGVTPAPLQHFETFEAWRSRQSSSSHGLGFFQGIDDSPSLYDGYRELQCFQRLQILYPELVQEIVTKIEALPAGKSPDEGTNRLLWIGYEKMANLADVADAGIRYTRGLHEGEVNPRALLI